MQSVSHLWLARVIWRALAPEDVASLWAVVRWRWLLARFGGLVGCLLLLNGCGVGFLWHTAVGQMTLLSRQEPVEEVIQAGKLSAKEEEKLRLILDVRTFAIEHLGLQANDSYTTFVDVGGPYVSYNVSAAPKDALQPYVWRFPIVGTFPYKGFFKKKYALREARKLRKKGYDTYVRGVRAYSTLGYFTDPILSSMLGYSDYFLMQTIIHELVHQTVWIKGSVSFNESLANFVGRKGTEAYLVWRDGKDSPIYQHYQDVRADAVVFREYMHGIVTRLEALYASPLSRDEKILQRAPIFAAAKADYPTVFPRMKTTRYRRYFERRTLNNAVMLSFRRYNRDTTYFEDIFKAHDGDLRRMLAHFATLRPDQIPAKFRTR